MEIGFPIHCFQFSWLMFLWIDMQLLPSKQYVPCILVHKHYHLFYHLIYVTTKRQDKGKMTFEAMCYYTESAHLIMWGRWSGTQKARRIRPCFSLEPKKVIKSKKQIKREKQNKTEQKVRKKETWYTIETFILPMTYQVLWLGQSHNSLALNDCC